MQLHAEMARGAIDDAGLEKDDVDGYFTAACRGTIATSRR